MLKKLWKMLGLKTGQTVWKPYWVLFIHSLYEKLGSNVPLYVPLISSSRTMELYIYIYIFFFFTLNQNKGEIQRHINL